MSERASSVRTIADALVYVLPPLWGKVARTKCATEGGAAASGPPSASHALGTFPRGRKIVAKSLVVAASFALSACGFHPLYGSMDTRGGGARQVFSSIYVDPIAGEHIGYELRNSLINSLQGAARPEQALYRLKVSVEQYVQGIVVENNAAITRYNYTLNAHYELSEAKSGKVLKSGTEATLSAYDVVASPYATEVAQQDAQKRGAEDIATRMQIDLAVFFSKHPQPVAAK